LANGSDARAEKDEVLRLRRLQRVGPRLRPGDRLKGRYQLVEKIGRGGFGIVWKALDRRDQRLVAVKVLHHDLAEEPSRRARFLRGAARMADLNHPGIVKVLRRRAADGYWLFFVMEYVAGGDLQRRVTSGGLPPSQVHVLIARVAQALGHAHAQGLVHRDVSPSNVLLDEEGRPHLTDFDLVRAVDTTGGTRTGALGKAFYAAPEAWTAGKDCDARADVYSLAAVAVFALHGSIDDELLREGLESLDCAPALKAVLKRALSRKPEGRYADAAAFGLAWEQALAAPTATPPPPQAVAPPAPAVIVAGSVERAPALRPFSFVTVTLDERGQEMKRETLQERLFVEDLGEGVGLEMVAVKAGRFLMGSPENEGSRLDREGPQHEVSVAAFFMGRFAVTQAQWRRIAAWPQVRIPLDLDPARFEGDQRPVERVSWYDAIEFCARLSARSGRRYRLPSEAEWEYAARAGTSSPFAFGATIAPEIVNYNGNHPYARASKGDYRAATTPVGSLGVANRFGLFDLHGNVWEWCQDLWHADYHGAPDDGRAWEPGGGAALRVLRGGSWLLSAWNCRSAFRLGYAPDVRHLDIGVRVVCEVART
jgi:formylglycine-generating enzyme required for sulfatase activity